MNKNVKIAKELVKLAKELCSSGVGMMWENQNAPKHDNGNLPILDINVSESDILNSAFYEDIYNMLSKEAESWENATCDLEHYRNKFSQEVVTEAEDYLKMIVEDVLDITYEVEESAYICVEDIVDGLKKLAANKTTYMDGNFADWSKYYDRQPMRNAQDVLEAASDAYNEALGTFGTKYNFTTQLDELFMSFLKADVADKKNSLSEEAKQLIEKAYL